MRCRPSVRTITGKRSSPYFSARFGHSGGRMWACVSIFSIGKPWEDAGPARFTASRSADRLGGSLPVAARGVALQQVGERVDAVGDAVGAVDPGRGGDVRAGVGCGGRERVAQRRLRL